MIDELFDVKMQDPGKFTFEKMISGAYIGGITLETLKAAALDGIFASKYADKVLRMSGLSTAELDHFLKNPRQKTNTLGTCFGGR